MIEHYRDPKLLQEELTPAQRAGLKVGVLAAGVGGGALAIWMRNRARERQYAAMLSELEQKYRECPDDACKKAVEAQMERAGIKYTDRSVYSSVPHQMLSRYF